MIEEDQIKICKIIAKSCMWGYGGIASVILNELQQHLPHKQNWLQVYNSVKDEAKCEEVGTVSSAQHIERLLRDGYYLCNYKPGKLQIRRANGGLYKYIIGPLADEYGLRLH